MTSSGLLIGKRLPKTSCSKVPCVSVSQESSIHLAWWMANHRECLGVGPKKVGSQGAKVFFGAQSGCSLGKRVM